MENLAVALMLLGIVLFIAGMIYLMAKVDKSENNIPSLILTFVFGASMICFMYFGAITSAYNQMRHNYKITYKMDENMNVTDTIIHVE